MDPVVRDIPESPKPDSHEQLKLALVDKNKESNHDTALKTEYSRTSDYIQLCRVILILRFSSAKD